MSEVKKPTGEEISELNMYEIQLLTWACVDIISERVTVVVRGRSQNYAEGACMERIDAGILLAPFYPRSPWGSKRKHVCDSNYAHVNMHPYIMNIPMSV